jgi:hypothetical protein
MPNAIPTGTYPRKMGDPSSVPRQNLERALASIGAEAGVSVSGL